MTFEGFTTPKKNYFPMPNNWTDIAADINNLAELKVVEYIMRHTWGYHEYGIKKAITTDEFMHGRKRSDGTRIDKGTGLSNRSVIDGLRAATKHGYIESDLDDADKARKVKYYVLKMAEPDVKHLHISDVNNLHTGTRYEEPSQPMFTSFTSDMKNVHSGSEEVSHRSEKDTLEKHLQKDTLEKQESNAPTSLADTESSSHSQSAIRNDGEDEDDTPTKGRMPAITGKQFKRVVKPEHTSSPAREVSPGSEVAQGTHERTDGAATAGDRGSEPRASDEDVIQETAKQKKVRVEKRQDEIITLYCQLLGRKIVRTKDNLEGARLLAEAEVTDAEITQTYKAYKDHAFWGSQLHLKNIAKLLDTTVSKKAAPPAEKTPYNSIEAALAIKNGTRQQKAQGGHD